MSDQDNTGAQGFDLGALLDQAQAIQQQMMAAQQEQANQVVTGEAAGGKVRVEMTAAGDFRAVRIDPGVVDPDEIDLLEDLVLTALRDASAKAAEAQAEAMRGLGLGGEGMGGLGGLLGA
jgi:nucleoid-associated protein EbfC